MTRAKRIAILTVLTMIPVVALAAAAAAPELGVGDMLSTFMGNFFCSGGCPNGG